MRLDFLTRMPFAGQGLYRLLYSRATEGLARRRMTPTDAGMGLPELRAASDFTAYVHFPFCSSACRYCAFRKTLQTDRVERYCASLVREIDLFASRRTAPGARLTSVYLGGGTPSLVPPPLLRQVCTRLLDSFAHNRSLSMTLECSAESLNLDHVGAYCEMGIRRLSVGVQSLNEAVLREMGRPPHPKDLIERLRALPAAGLANFGVDLMHGFDSQNLDILLDDLDKIMSCDPAHITLYPLVDGRGTGGRARRQEKQYRAARRALTANGYAQYSTEDFIRDPGMRDAYQMDCWSVPSKEMVAFGTSGFGTLDGHFYTKEGEISRYEEGIERGLWPIASAEPVGGTHEAAMRLLLGLRYLDVDRAAFERAYGVDPASKGVPIVGIMKRLGFVGITESTVRLGEHACFPYSLLWAMIMLAHLQGRLVSVR